MAGGRPTKFTDETLGKVKSYIKNYKDEDDLIPSLAGLAVFLGINRATVYDWKENKPAFSDMLEELLFIQEKILLTGGLSGNMNSTITKLVLAKHNYSDKQETDITTGGEKIEVITRTVIDKA